MIGNIKNPALRRAMIVLTFPLWTAAYLVAYLVAGLIDGINAWTEDLSRAW